MSRTTSGRVRTRFSLHPSSAAPPKSAAFKLRCCSIVPIAPSSTRIRCPSSSRKAFADSFRLRIRWKVTSPCCISGQNGCNYQRNLAFPDTSILPRFPCLYLSQRSELVFFRCERQISHIERQFPGCYTGSGSLKRSLMTQRLKILNIVGARPNLPKIAPLMREMQRHPEIEAILVHTGQHYDEKLSDIFFRQIGIPVAHVEAGLRSFDRTMPEEINRILTDALADYLFVTEEDAIEHLLKEGRPRSSIFMVGNVMIDSLRHFLPIAQQSAIGDELALKNGAGWRRFGVLTLHRPSNVDSTEKLSQLLGAIDAVAAEMPVIFPVHPRTQQRLTQGGIQHHAQLRLIPPVGYLDLLCLMSKSTLVLTDSGGIQEETTALGVPCLTLRENTERPITI